jgi:ABC-type bacteriocin/lantibiotic exporter with double-glycine peptidase domain
MIQAETQKSSVMIESIAGMRTVKALALEPRRREVWDERVAEATAARLALSRVANWPQTLVLPFERFIYAGTLLVGAWLSVAGDSAITIGSLMAFAMIAGRVATPLSSLAQLLQEYQEVRGAIGNVAHVLNRAPERAAGAVGARPHIMGAVSFSEVTFRYPGSQTTALQDLSFEAAAGTMVGIVGKSGSGKSTITRLLQGISTGYAGLVKIDSIELREIDLAHLRRSLGIVMQDNFLFRGTIRENITAGRPGLSFEDVVRAARLAGAEEFIERLPGGYDTYIEEGSPNLSGGQRQRVAIARALVTDPRVLILDEATSMIDAESEHQINAAIDEFVTHPRAPAAGGVETGGGLSRTCLVVAHRLSTVLHADRIVVIDGGRAAEQGDHAELLAADGVYARLCALQFGAAA